MRKGVVVVVLAALITAVLSGCGYKPVSIYGRNLFGSRVYVDVKLSGVEPANGIFLKEEIMRIVRERFDSDTVNSAASAESVIVVPKYRFAYSSLTTDSNGYVTRYRVDTDITFELHTQKGKALKSVHVSEDVGVKASSLTTSAARETAIRYSIRKAMDEFIAYVAEQGYFR